MMVLARLFEPHAPDRAVPQAPRPVAELLGAGHPAVAPARTQRSLQRGVASGSRGHALIRRREPDGFLGGDPPPAALDELEPALEQLDLGEAVWALLGGPAPGRG